MSANAYELLALAMRYVFAGLMLLIVLRAWRISMVDSRRANRLRRLSPETGIVGEMLVVNGGDRARPGMHYAVTLEGSIGSGRRADIRVRHSSVRSRHAIYQMTEDGLFVRGHAHARIRDEHGRVVRELLLRDGEILRVGNVALMLVLTDGGSAPEEINRRILRKRAQHHRTEENNAAEIEMDDSIFEMETPEKVDIDDLFKTNPAGSFYDGTDADDCDEYDGYDDYDDSDDDYMDDYTDHMWQ